MALAWAVVASSRSASRDRGPSFRSTCTRRSTCTPPLCRTFPCIDRLAAAAARPCRQDSAGRAQATLRRPARSPQNACCLSKRRGARSEACRNRKKFAHHTFGRKASCEKYKARLESQTSALSSRYDRTSPVDPVLVKIGRDIKQRTVDAVVLPSIEDAVHFHVNLDAEICVPNELREQYVLFFFLMRTAKPNAWFDQYTEQPPASLKIR